jgi:urocanate reductase
MAGARFIDESSTASPEAFAWIDAALSINAASQGPDWGAGPVWDIFDSGAVSRNNWTIGYPNTDPLYFYQANDLNTLAQMINTHAYQTTTMSGATLTATVARYNSLVTAGAGDTDFGKKAFTKQCNTPPYYAAFAAPVVHDTLTGVKTSNDTMQVQDLDDNGIPNLFAAGEMIGGMSAHGLFKVIVQGIQAGRSAAAQAPFLA